MTTSTGVWSAVIAAVVAVVVAVVTQLWIGRRERRGRVATYRHAAIRSGQDAALQLRNRLAEFGPVARQLSGAPSDELVRAETGLDEAFAELDVAMTRIGDADLVAAVAAWRERVRFHYVSAEEVTTAEELQLWATMNAGFGAALLEP